ncbi:MAG: hypothetical protein H6581_03315 [Bacteroidia bacterium]|nr:hypothetical protein [Bacteroidia bacterium]
MEPKELKEKQKANAQPFGLTGNETSAAVAPPPFQLKADESATQPVQMYNPDEMVCSEENYYESQQSSMDQLMCTEEGYDEDLARQVLEEDEAAQAAANEWDPSKGNPVAGQTLGGNALTNIKTKGVSRAKMTIGSRNYWLYKRGGYWGIFYPGTTNRAAIYDLADEYRNTPGVSEYYAKAVEAFAVLNEGGFSAINTYDNMTFTLGSGYAGGRLNTLLQSWAGTDLGNALSATPYLSGLNFNGSDNIRLDINAINDIVTIMETPAYQNDVMRQTIENFVGSNCKAGQNTTRENSLVAGGMRSEVLGVAAYLYHGRPAFTPTPPADVQKAMNLHPNNPSAQVAVLLKLHAQRIADSTNSKYGPESNEAADAVNRRLPHKIENFTREMRRNEGSGWNFDLSAAQAEMPCIGTDDFSGGSSQPAGLWLKANGEFYDFGVRR